MDYNKNSKFYYHCWTPDTDAENDPLKHMTDLWLQVQSPRVVTEMKPLIA